MCVFMGKYKWDYSKPETYATINRKTLALLVATN
jgi:hypothetical protein